MGKKIVTQYGEINIEKANQTRPYKLYKKIFKSKENKQELNELKNIILKYFPNYTESDIDRLYAKLSEHGCTYASMANVLVDQLNKMDSWPSYFENNFIDRNGNVNYNKLLVDIYACVSKMVEVKIRKCEVKKFSSIEDATLNIFGVLFDNHIIALNNLNKAGWLADGIDNDGLLIFKNGRTETRSYIGTYQDIAKEVFGIDDIGIDKENLEKMFRDNRIEYNFNYLDDVSKFSGLLPVKVNNLEKWMSKYFEVNNIDLSLDVKAIVNKDVDFRLFEDSIYDKMNDGYSIEVGATLKSDVWMTDGKNWDRPTNDRAGHQMNFEGFDKMGNIIVCSWGTRYMFPKDFYQDLEFMAIKIQDSKMNKKK